MAKENGPERKVELLDLCTVEDAATEGQLRRVYVGQKSLVQYVTRSVWSTLEDEALQALLASVDATLSVTDKPCFAAITFRGRTFWLVYTEKGYILMYPND